MNSAILPNGSVIYASSYREDVHGRDLFCVDPACRTRVIYVPRSPNMAAHFKTTGKADSKHKPGCGFYEPLSVPQAISKVKEYQNTSFKSETPTIIISLNLNSLDPDYVPKPTTRQEKEEQKEKKISVKEGKEVPSRVASVKAIVNLLLNHEPDVLASIHLRVGGKNIPLSKIIVNQEDAHQLLWSGESFRDVGYFVYGEIGNIVHREKVLFLNFKEVNRVPFAIILFEKYFNYFAYRDEDLIGKQVLVYGLLRKNEYEGRQRTEIMIKSDKYLELLRSTLSS